jgi:hypothetical protein
MCDRDDFGVERLHPLEDEGERFVDGGQGAHVGSR